MTFQGLLFYFILYITRVFESIVTDMVFSMLSFQVELVDPPISATVGERVTFPGYEGVPDDVLNPKKKVWEAVQGSLHTDFELVACYKDVPFTTSGGVCKVLTISDGLIR